MSNELEIEIIDPISSHDMMAIEVAVTLNGEVRYCYFATPEGLKNFGDWIPGTEVRIHYDCSTVITVSKISKEIIEAAIQSIYRDGKLNEVTHASC